MLEFYFLSQVEVLRLEPVLESFHFFEELRVLNDNRCLVSKNDHMPEFIITQQSPSDHGKHPDEFATDISGNPAKERRRFSFIHGLFGNRSSPNASLVYSAPQP
jgi:hypothetical protein